MSQNAPISWRSIVYETPVIASDGERVGKVREVLGDDAEDIFHGLRVALDAGHRDVMVPADAVTSLAADSVRVDLTRSAIEALGPYEEQATYHLASVGWLRKHLGWKKDFGERRGAALTACPSASRGRQVRRVPRRGIGSSSPPRRPRRRVRPWRP